MSVQALNPVKKELTICCFNTSYVSVQEIYFLLQKYKKCVSIHPMCRFKAIDQLGDINYLVFQYILCVGSSAPFVCCFSEYYAFQYILCVGSSFNAAGREDVNGQFQYILCVGSSIVFK